MHELGIATSALDAALARARDAGAHRVSKIELRVGELSGVDPEALRFALEGIVPGTAAEGAAIAISSVSPLLRCSRCEYDYAPTGGLLFECPRCGETSAAIRQGRELELVRLDLD